MALKPFTGNYKKAFQCKKCPQRGDEMGCPMWWEIPVEQEDNPTVQELMKGCGYALMPNVLRSVIKAGWTGAAEVSKMRSEVVDSVERASVRVLQLQGAEMLRLGGSEMGGHNEPSDGLVLEEGPGGDGRGDVLELGPSRRGERPDN